MKKPDKEQYTRLIPEGVENAESLCYFCNDPGSMDDYTPNRSASQYDMDTYDGPWNVVKACNPCWRRIYTANINLGAASYDGRMGMMTLEQKEALIGKSRRKRQIKRITRPASKAFVINEDLGLVLPSEFIRSGNSIQIGARAYTHDELLLLQGPIIAAFLLRPREHVELLLGQAMTSLDPENLEVYENMLGLRETGTPASPQTPQW